MKYKVIMQIEYIKFNLVMIYNLDKQVGILCVYLNILLGEFIVNVVSCLGVLVKFILNVIFLNFLN